MADEIEFNHFPQLMEAIHQAANKAVRKAAFDIAAHEQDNAPVQSGFLKSSIYSEFADSSTYGQGVQGEGELLPEIDKAEDDTTAYVAVGAEYGVYVNYGTSKMTARPFVEPAVEAVRPGFESAMAKLEEKLREVK
jgi:HK97 gp10 family phage protein